MLTGLRSTGRVWSERLVVWVRGLGRGISFAWVLISKSDSAILSAATGGGSGVGLARGVSGSLSTDLAKGKAVSMVWG